QSAPDRRRARRSPRRAQYARPVPRQSHLGSMQYLAPDALARARRVRLVIFDVDGVLTDGRLWYGPGGEELKAFHAFDGHGVHLLRMAGLDTAIISGRQSQAVAERAKELAIKHVVQGASDKRQAFERMLRRLKVAPSAAAYMGDDVVALPTLWLDHQVRVEGGDHPSLRRHDPDYLVANFTTTTYNRDGHAETVLAAAQMQHFPDDDSTEVSGPRLVQSKPEQPRFSVQA